MSTGTIIIIAAVLLALAAVFVLATSSRRDKDRATGRLSRETRKRDRSHEAIAPIAAEEGTVSSREIERAAVLERTGAGTSVVPAKPAPPAVRAPIDDEQLGVTRRQFFNRSIAAVFGLGLTGFGATTIAFLWPSLSGGFGSQIRAGQLSDILATIANTREPIYLAEGRFYLNPYPTSGLGAAAEVYSGGVLTGMEAGVVALYQKCPHLGCRVPWCKSSQWFECPCHGSKYNRVGEKTAGPAPRGMDLFPVAIDGGAVVVDTGQIIQGVPIGIDTTGQQPEGPFCA